MPEIYIRSVWNIRALSKLLNLIKTQESELPKIAQSLVESYDELSTEDMLKETAHLRFLKASNATKESLGLP